MPYELCRHIKSNGRRCESPALREKSWCFYHERLHTRHRYIREAKATLPDTSLRIPSLEDPESIQIGLSLVVEALATGRLDDKRASVLIRGLQAASRNVAHVINSPYYKEVVREFTPTLDGLALAPAKKRDAPITDTIANNIAAALFQE
ncbi:hypothetical protein HDF16_001341 [Granulicella aggregans]|uniref:Uncharacterized protein n=1 Tax=Granulicella aggregans TaxID=474949 RepID=A0A7W8E2R5_9BACT|nr:hypothetical protein [Granulicella aggregans]MBB5056656.1 hypothetical protein [Granulicella aggregans]